MGGESDKSKAGATEPEGESELGVSVETGVTGLEHELQPPVILCPLLLGLPNCPPHDGEAGVPVDGSVSEVAIGEMLVDGEVPKD